MALCELPQLFPRRTGIAPITPGVRLDVIIAAWTQSLLPDLAKQEIFDGMGITSAVAQSLRTVAAAVRGGHGVGGGSEPESVGYHAA